jgi:hypothetical protein
MGFTRLMKETGRGLNKIAQNIGLGPLYAKGHVRDNLQIAYDFGLGKSGRVARKEYDRAVESLEKAQQTLDNSRTAFMKEHGDTINQIKSLAAARAKTTQGSAEYADLTRQINALTGQVRRSKEVGAHAQNAVLAGRKKQNLYGTIGSADEIRRLRAEGKLDSISELKGGAQNAYYDKAANAIEAGFNGAVDWALARDYKNRNGRAMAIAQRGAVMGLGYMGVNTGMRVLTGGDMLHNNTGERDIAGIPFI